MQKEHGLAHRRDCIPPAVPDARPKLSMTVAPRMPRPVVVALSHPLRAHLAALGLLRPATRAMAMASDPDPTLLDWVEHTPTLRLDVWGAREVRRAFSREARA